MKKKKETDISEPIDSKAVTVKVSKVSVVSNIVLCAFKLVAGIVAHSSAMVADAVHSLSDVAGSALVIVGAFISNKASDGNHPYGHDRLECIISLILANVLLLVGAGIGYNGAKEILMIDTPVKPGTLALVAAVVSIVVKEALYWYTRAAANKINSVSLRAEAWHHRSDALSSVGSFVGIFGAMMGIAILQPIVCILIAAMIIKVAFDVYRDTFDRLVDKACDDEMVNNLTRIITNQPGVIALDDLKTRLFGSKIYVDIEIACDGKVPLKEAHGIAESVHNALEKECQCIKHCTVHVNPR